MSNSLTVSGGQIIDSNGQPFIAKGINMYADCLMSVGAATVTNTFPGVNFIRVNVFDLKADTAAVLAPVVNALTAQGVVVELEDHNYPDVLTGANLTAAEQWYSSLASTFAANSRVVFGTQNEPSEPTPTPGAIDTEITGIYAAIRATGNNNLVLMNPWGGFSNASWTLMDPSKYAGMTNVVWDLHYYNWLL